MTNFLLGDAIMAVSLFLTLAFLVYLANSLFLLLKSKKSQPAQEVALTTRPEVAIHLPIYNEFYVVDRVIQACTRVAEKYGKDKVRIYVIDDSTDETRAKVDSLVSEFGAQGFRFKVVRRGTRRGFKAGALQSAFGLTTEKYVAVLDADFVPPPDFLNRTVGMLEEDESIGFVQARWGHLDRDYNLLTGSVAIGIDAHFLLEQRGRNGAGYLMVFNGSAGVLRSSAIREAGGWDDDTLTEDLDLSYRLQLAGYRGVFLGDLQVPGELPPTVTGLKRQQGRWARGYMQTSKKLLGRIRKSKALTRSQKIEAGIHLTYYIVHPLMVISFLLVVSAALLPGNLAQQEVFVPFPGVPGGSSGTAGFDVNASQIFPLLVVFSTLMVLYYSVESLRIQNIELKSSTKQVFLLMVLGYGMSISNSVQAIAGLVSKETGTFFRTPKYAVTKAGESWRKKNYQLPLNSVTALEGAAVLLGTIALSQAISADNMAILPILSMYIIGYGSVLALTLGNALGRTGRRDI